MRAALQWSDDSGDDTTLLRLAGALGRYWWVRGLLQEGTHWLELALERNPDAEPALRSRALSGLGIIRRQQGNFERASGLLEEAIALTRMLGDTRLFATQLIDLASVLQLQRHYPEGVALLEKAVRVAEAEGDDWGAAAAHTFIGIVDIILGDPEAAEARLLEALPRFQSTGDRRGAVIVTFVLAYVNGLRGDTTRALPLLNEALHIGRQHLPDVTIGPVVGVAASVLSRVAAPAACARLLGASEVLWVQGLRQTPFDQAVYSDALTVLSARLDREDLTAGLHAGRQLSAQQVIDEALALIQEARAIGQTGAAPASPSGRQRRSRGTGGLSVRELEVLRLMAEGYSNKGIGERLGISVNTTKFHVTSIMNKLGVNSRVEAVTEAVKRGLV